METILIVMRFLFCEREIEKCNLVCRILLMTWSFVFYGGFVKNLIKIEHKSNKRNLQKREF